MSLAIPSTIEAPDRLTLARTLSRQGLPARAYAMLLEMHEAALPEGDTLHMAATADCLADCCYMMAQYEQGIYFSRSANSLWKAQSNPARQAGSLSRMAVMLATIGEPEALVEAEAALNLAEHSGSAAQIIRALEANGVVLTLLLQPERGLPFNERALALSRRCDLPDGLTLIDLAEVTISAAQQAAARASGKAGGPGLTASVVRALDLTREALGLARITGDGWLERLAINNIAEYSLHVGDAETAELALADFDLAAGEPTNRCRIHHLMVRGRTLAAKGHLDAAISALVACQTVALETGDLETATPCHLDLALAHARLGDYESAFAAHRTYHELYLRQTSEAAQRRARIFAFQREAEALRTAAEQAQALVADLSASNALLAREAERLARTSLEDPLTGLCNRRRLDMAFDELLLDDTAFTIAMIDVDDFKAVNDLFSHPVGDAVLRKIAALLVGRARQCDLVARYGGEEFAFLIRDADLHTVELACEQLRHSVQAADWGALRAGLAVTISIGVAVSSEAASHESVLLLADDRLYQAKREGRNRVVMPSTSRLPSVLTPTSMMTAT